MKEQRIQIIVITVAIIVVVAVTAFAMNKINSSTVNPETKKTTTTANTVASSNMGVNINYAISAIVNEKLQPIYDSGEISYYSVVSAEQLSAEKECGSYKDASYQIGVELKYVKKATDKEIFPGSERVSENNALETIAKVNFVMKDKGDGESGYTIVDDFSVCDQ